MKRLVIAHLSDMHLSQFGERVTATALLTGRLPRAGLTPRVEWKDLEELDGWRIQHWNGLAPNSDRSLGLRLLDPNGVRHARPVIAPGRGHTRRVDDTLERLRTLVQVRSKASLSRLCKVFLPPDERSHLITLDPNNTNLRFLEALDEVRTLSPDVVVLTGDLTDDGRGYELVLCRLHDYIEEGRFFAVAGNHDLSAVPPGTSHNMPLTEKAGRWSAFRCAAGIGKEQSGASGKVIDDVFFLGLNSSVQPSKVAFSGRGRVGKRQLAVATALIRATAPQSSAQICCLHHHVAHLSLGPIARTDPGQFAMKLRDAREVMDLLADNDFTAVLNGHRHHGYHLHKANLPHVISSPSTTLGCRGSQTRYFWLLTMEKGGLRVDRHHIGRR